jgi:hypothetical protein
MYVIEMTFPRSGFGHPLGDGRIPESLMHPATAAQKIKFPRRNRRPGCPPVFQRLLKSFSAFFSSGLTFLRVSK